MMISVGFFNPDLEFVFHRIIEPPHSFDRRLIVEFMCFLFATATFSNPLISKYAGLSGSTPVSVRNIISVSLCWHQAEIYSAFFLFNLNLTLER